MAFPADQAHLSMCFRWNLYRLYPSHPIHSLSTYPSVLHPFFYTFIHPFTRPSTIHSLRHFPSIHTHKLTHASLIFPSVRPSIHPSSHPFYPKIHPSSHSSIYLTVRPSTHPCTHPPLHPLTDPSIQGIHASTHPLKCLPCLPQSMHLLISAVHHSHQLRPGRQRALDAE